MRRQASFRYSEHPLRCTAMWRRMLYIAACVVIPLAWGLVIVWASNHFDGVLKRARPGRGNPMHPEDSTRVDFHI